MTDHEETPAATRTDNLSYAPLQEDPTSSLGGHVDLKLDDEATLPSNDYKFTFKTCCFGKISLRVGCILIASLYMLYALLYLGLILTFVLLLDVTQSENKFAAIWNLNMAIFEAYFIIFALVFLCLGIEKLDYRRILVCKWIMVVYEIINIVIQIRIIALGHWFFALMHVIFFILLPATTIVYLHSYEAQLWKVHKRSEGIPTLLKCPPKL